jgi:glycerol-3-phosphate acyltransferase PlsY
MSPTLHAALAFGLAAMTGYWLGSIPFGLLLTRLAGAGDLRAIGSGNIGATNVLRTGRKGLAASTLLLDAGKGALAVLLVLQLIGPDAALVAGAGAIFGHVFPVWLRFRGGKGVATALGVLLAAAWPVGVIACAIWLAVAAIVRISSAAALTALALAPFAALLLATPRTAVLAAFVAALIFWRHKANIGRLRAGTEPRIGR